jgi:NAD(P)-dependent dehydrogenase (short-subunit alcohol dehydrogenase family)
VKDLAGKTAVITGAASGIGLGVATRLAQAGMKVMMCDIERPALETAAAELKRATNADVESVVADVSLKSQLQAAADATLERFGEVHVLHSNAGIVGMGNHRTWTDAGWDWIVGVNLMSVVWGAEIFAPLIERHGQGGHIVNTASVAGLFARASGSYNVTKYGVVALSEGLRVELAPRGIGVSALCPGYVRTNLLDSRRNLPERFAGATLMRPPPPPEPGAAPPTAPGRSPLLDGVDPLYVGDLVREGIENDWPYIFTDNDFEEVISTRLAEIKQGFDRIRGRTPYR